MVPVWCGASAVWGVGVCGLLVCGATQHRVGGERAREGLQLHPESSFFRRNTVPEEGAFPSLCATRTYEASHMPRPPSSDGLCLHFLSLSLSISSPPLSPHTPSFVGTGTH